MEKFKELQRLCKCSVSIGANNHRDYYQSVADYLFDCNLDDEDIDSVTLQKMIDTDTVIEVYCYPNTPIGSYRVFHYDVNMAMDLMLECVKNNN